MAFMDKKRNTDISRDGCQIPMYQDVKIVNGGLYFIFSFHFILLFFSFFFLIFYF